MSVDDYFTISTEQAYEVLARDSLQTLRHAASEMGIQKIMAQMESLPDEALPDIPLARFHGRQVMRKMVDIHRGLA